VTVHAQGLQGLVVANCSMHALAVSCEDRKETYIRQFFCYLEGDRGRIWRSAAELDGTHSCTSRAFYRFVVCKVSAC
jgi:hypothetical protein